MPVIFTDRQFERVQSTTRELRKLTKSIRGTQVSSKQRDRLIEIGRQLTDQLAEHQK